MKLTHIDKKGNAKMVFINNKKNTKRIAIAFGTIKVNRNLLELITKESIPKGDVLTVSKIAGIFGVKNTSNLIPMCHPLLIEGIDIELKINLKNRSIDVICRVDTTGKTGVEMEALIGVSITLLTIYDMCKSIDKSICIKEIKLLKKTGGKSDNYTRKE